MPLPFINFSYKYNVRLYHYAVICGDFFARHFLSSSSKSHAKFGTVTRQRFPGSIPLGCLVSPSSMERNKENKSLGDNMADRLARLALGKMFRVRYRWAIVFHLVSWDKMVIQS